MKHGHPATGSRAELPRSRSALPPLQNSLTHAKAQKIGPPPENWSPVARSPKQRGQQLVLANGSSIRSLGVHPPHTRSSGRLRKRRRHPRRSRQLRSSDPPSPKAPAVPIATNKPATRSSLLSAQWTTSYFPTQTPKNSSKIPVHTSTQEHALTPRTPVPPHAPYPARLGYPCPIRRRLQRSMPRLASRCHHAGPAF